VSCVMPHDDEDKSKVLLAELTRDVAHLPEAILRVACEGWRRTSKYWPHASELLAIAEPMLDKHYRDLDYLRYRKDQLDVQAAESDPVRSGRAKEVANRELAKMRSILGGGE